MWVLFYFIMTNIFLSIILDVWHKEKERLDHMHAMQENVDIMHGWRRVLLDTIKYFADPRTYSRFFRKLKHPKNLPGLCIREICGDSSAIRTYHVCDLVGNQLRHSKENYRTNECCEC